MHARSRLILTALGIAIFWLLPWPHQLWLIITAILLGLALVFLQAITPLVEPEMMQRHLERRMFCGVALGVVLIMGVFCYHWLGH